MKALGTHLLLDLWQIPRALLDDLDALEGQLVTAAKRGGAHVVEARFHRFEPHGVSGVVILMESHLALHTWPELGYAAVDVFTCGCNTVAEAIASEIIKTLAPGRHDIRRLERGQRIHLESINHQLTVMNPSTKTK